MPDLDLQVAQDARAAIGPGVLEATVATSPGDENDELFVTIDSFATDQRYGPVLGWASHPTATSPILPVRGDSAVVVEVREGLYWLLAWSPA